MAHHLVLPHAHRAQVLERKYLALTLALTLTLTLALTLTLPKARSEGDRPEQLVDA